MFLIQQIPFFHEIVISALISLLSVSVWPILPHYLPSFIMQISIDPGEPLNKIKIQQQSNICTYMYVYSTYVNQSVEKNPRK